VRGASQAPMTLRRSQGGASLRVGQDARDSGVGTTPEFGSEVGSTLDHDELDQRRGVEIEDQRRCSLTRSDTEPVASMWAE
jgi:hypothetical protein